MLLKSGGGRLKERFSFPVAAMAAYMLFVAVSAAWASAGKFFLREYSKLLIAFAVYLFALLCVEKTKKSIDAFLTFLTAGSAVYALLSVDMATLKLFKPLLYLIPGYDGIDTGFETGTRLTGIFGSANTLGGLLAVGILLNFYLIDAAESRAKRLFYSVLISFSAYAFILSFSMGATGFFALSAIAYLALAGRRRGVALLHMLFTLVPAFAFVFVSFGFFEAEGAALAIPPLCMLANAAATAFLEAFLYPRLEASLNGNSRAVLRLLLAVALLAAAYGCAAFLFTGPYELEAGKSFRRSIYPAAGTYGLSADYTGDLTVSVVSQDDYDVMKHTETSLYSGPADGASFTVPEGSRVVYISFNTGGGAEIKKAVLSDGSSIKLKYILLPDFIANRLQGLLANENMIQRTVFFSDGMKLFRRSPVLGNGMGSFESLVCGYQDFHYETKYVHNNYIQVLLDSGIAGFAAYMSLLIGTLLLLIKGRKKEGEPAALRPALGSAFVMICTHSYMEVVMSALVYLPFAFSVFALAVLCYGGGPSKKSRPAGRAAAAASRWGSLALTTVYPLLIIMNLCASTMVASSTDSLPALYKALSAAVRLDCFEYNDYALSAVTNYPFYRSPLYKGFVDKCSARLLDTPSNSLHQGLIEYYMEMGQPDKAIEAAKKGVGYNYSNPEIWNGYFELFYSYASREGTDNPFLGESGSALTNGINELYDLMLEYNKKLWEPITLSSDSQALIDYVNSLHSDG